MTGKPKMLQWSDLLVPGIPALVGLGLPILGVSSHMRSDTWGAPVAPHGWAILLIFIIFTVVGITRLYWQRWEWVQQYAFTSSIGVNYYYQLGLKAHLRVDVDAETASLLTALKSLFADEPDAPALETYLQGAIVVFVAGGEGGLPAGVFTYGGRKVWGIAQSNSATVGHLPVLSKTAHKHELAHLYLNRYRGGRLSEDQEHRIFQDLGI